VFRSNQNRAFAFFVSCNFTERSFQVKEIQRAKMASEGTAKCIDILLAIILPPLGVFLKYGCQVFINFASFSSWHKDFSRNFGYFLFRVDEL